MGYLFTVEQRRNIVLLYKSGRSVYSLAQELKYSPYQIYMVLRDAKEPIRGVRESQLLRRQLERVKQGLCPTPEEIIERARQIREEGYMGADDLGQPVFRPPWTDEKYYDRAGVNREPYEVKTVKVVVG